MGFRIDIGVGHNDYNYGYLAGIECDGATYHRTAFARDRDRLRQDILENLGLQDITSLIDFKRLIEISKKYKLKIDAFCTQGNFLLNHGILERKKKILRKCNQKQIKQIESGYKKLVNKNYMGNIFKFLILSND